MPSIRLFFLVKEPKKLLQLRCEAQPPPSPPYHKEGFLSISLSGERNETKREGENGPELGARLSDFRNHSKNALRFNGISYFVPQAAKHPETQ